MDELTLVRDLRSDAPHSAAPAAGRQRLLRAAVNGARPARRRWRPVVATAGLGTLAVASLLVVQAGPGAGPSAAAVLGHAARVVADQPFTAPRPDQWLYEKSLGVDPVTGQRGTHPVSSWSEFDGSTYAELNDGRLTREPLAAGQESPLDHYRALAALPSDPQALLQALRDGALGPEKGTTQADRDFYGVYSALSLETVIPPRVQAALYNALATIPGVGIDPNAAPDLVGRPVLSVTFSGRSPFGQAESRSELLLDPTSYAFLGIRETALQDLHFDKSEVTPAGTVWYNDAYLAVDVVDRVGETG